MNFLFNLEQDEQVYALPSRANSRAKFGLRITLASALLTIVCLLLPTTARAQSSTALTAVYGRGVHAYFAGNTAQAEQHFSEVIQAGSTDPRAYYFRAVLRLQQGRQFEAENDMRIGAAYEARNPGVQHSIGRALQRVQGPARRTLEKFRRQARLDRVQQGRQQTQQRYENLRQRAPNVLRQDSSIPLSQPVQPPQLPAAGSGLRAPTMSGSGTTQPLPGSSSKPQPLPTQNIASPEPAAPTPATAAPLGSESKAADDSDPFGAPAPVTPAEDDLFGSDTKDAAPTPAPAAEADPFGELPTPTEEADPFGEDTSPATDESDPFSESPAPAEESTPPAEDDPFGESSDAAEPADSGEDDPFGESRDEEMESEGEAASDDDPFGESSSDESDDPFGDSPAEEADDPFGESGSDSTEDDPFGESADSSDDAPADDGDDPFGESMEEPAEEDSSDEEPVDDDDPFGEFGSLEATPPGSTFAAGQPNLVPTSNTAASGASAQFFFAVGQWLGSQGNNLTGPPNGDQAVALADFQLGPSESSQAEPAGVELAVDPEDPFAADPFADE